MPSIEQTVVRIVPHEEVQALSKYRVLSTYYDMRNRYIERPQIWSKAEVLDAVKSAINQNLRMANPYSHRTLGTIRTRAEERVKRKALGLMIRIAVRDADASAFMEVLDSAFMRSLSTVDRNASAFYDLVNDIDSDYHACNDCGHIDHRDEGGYVYDQDWVCQSCLDDNYYWSENRGTYVNEDDRDSEDDDDSDGEGENYYNGERVIGNRHDSKNILTHIPSAFDNRKPLVLMGMELEVEAGRDFDRAEKASELYDAIQYVNAGNIRHRYCYIEDDGSLNHGFEIVTGWTGLDVHAKQLAFFKNRWEGMRSHDTNTCGLHVHIDKKDVSLFHACKMVFFINDSNNQKLIRDVARRSNANYAKIGNKKASYDWLKQAKSNGMEHAIHTLNQDRSEALNFQNRNTIEFRLFKGTLRYETIMACLEFTYATWFFTRDTGVSDLTTPKFVDFICDPNNRKDTKFLRRYLKEKGYVLPKQAVDKANPRMDTAIAQPIETTV